MVFWKPHVPLPWIARIGRSLPPPSPDPPTAMHPAGLQHDTELIPVGVVALTSGTSTDWGVPHWPPVCVTTNALGIGVPPPGGNAGISSAAVQLPGVAQESAVTRAMNELT